MLSIFPFTKIASLIPRFLSHSSPFFCRGGAWIQGYKMATISLYTNMVHVPPRTSHDRHVLTCQCTDLPSYCWTSPVCFSLISPPPSAPPHTSHEYVCDKTRAEPLMRRTTWLEPVSFQTLPQYIIGSPTEDLGMRLEWYSLYTKPCYQASALVLTHYYLILASAALSHSALADPVSSSSLPITISIS